MKNPDLEDWPRTHRCGSRTACIPPINPFAYPIAFVVSLFFSFPLLIQASEAEAADLWHVISGKVSRVELISGEEFLRLHAGTPPAEIVRFLSDAEYRSDTVTVTFSILPSADFSSEPLSSLNVLGARMGFVAEDQHARIYALDGEETVAIPFRFGIFPDGEAEDWIEVMVTVFAVRERWQVSVNGVAFEREMKVDPKAAQAGVVQLIGHDSGDVYLGGFDVPNGNDDSALADDDYDDTDSYSDSTVATKDPDSVEAETTEDGSSRDNRRELRSRPHGNARTIFVCGDSGSDANDGFTPRAAKATIDGGVAAVADGGTVIILPHSPGYTAGRIDTEGKSVRLRATGPVRIR